MITSTGDNLTIFIFCHNKFEDSWAAYSSWYSMQKSLPDARVVVDVRSSSTNEVQDYFQWARKRQLLWKRSSERSCPALIIRPNWISVRELDSVSLELINNYDSVSIKHGTAEGYYRRVPEPETFKNIDEGFCVDVRSSEVASFVSYGDFGNFVLSEWINKKECPLFKTKTLEGISNNEKRVIELWEKAALTYKL